MSDTNNESHQRQSCCQSPKTTHALVWTVEPCPEPPSVQEYDKVILEHDDDQKNADDSVLLLKTPTSAAHIIQQVLTCPPAPKKPKSAPLRKRKRSHTLLDLSNDVLSLYPPNLLADFNKKLKKVRRDEDHLNKENISSAARCNI